MKLRVRFHLQVKVSVCRYSHVNLRSAHLHIRYLFSAEILSSIFPSAKTLGFCSSIGSALCLHQ